MSGAVYKNIQNFESTNTRSIHTQHISFNIDKKLLDVYNKTIIKDTNTDFVEYNSKKNKKELDPDSLSEIYNDIAFYKETQIITIGAPDDRPPNTPAFNEFKLNYIVPLEFHDLVFQNNNITSVASYIKNLEFIYRCDLETELKCLKYMGIVGGYLVIYGVSVIYGKNLLKMIVNMFDLDITTKKNIIIGLLYIAEWTNNASLMNTSILNNKIEKLRKSISEVENQEGLNKILTDVIIKDNKSSDDILSLLTSFSEFYMYLPIIYNEFNYLIMDSELRNSSRFKNMLQNILFNKSPFLQIVKNGRKQIYKIDGLKGSNLEWMVEMVFQMVNNPFYQYKFNTFVTNALTSQLFPESIVKDKFAQDGEKDPFNNKFDVIQLRKEGYTDKQLNDRFVELIEQKLAGTLNDKEYKYNPDELIKLIKIGFPLFFSVEFFNVMYQDDKIDIMKNMVNDKTSTGYAEVKKFINLIFTLIRSFIPDYTIKNYLINNFILTWRNALITTYNKIKDVLKKINTIAREHIQIYDMFSNWLNKELIYNFSISSIVSSFVDFFFSQSITNTFAGISRLLMMQDITSSNFLEKQFVENLNILRVSFNKNNLGKIINLLFTDKTTFFWSLFSGTVPDQIFNKFNILRDNLFIQQDKDLIDNYVYFKDSFTGKFTEKYKILKIGTHGSCDIIRDNRLNDYKIKILAKKSIDDDDELMKQDVQRIKDENEDCKKSFIVFEDNQGNPIFINSINDLFSNPKYYSNGKFNFYLLKSIDIKGFFAANYNQEHLHIEYDISSLIFRNVKLSDDHLHSFFRPDEKMLCYINFSKIIKELQLLQDNQNNNAKDYHNCLKLYGLDKIPIQQQIDYLRKIIENPNYSLLLEQISKFKDKNIEYLQKLNELIHNNFNPFAKNIIENVVLEKKTDSIEQSHADSFFIEVASAKLIAVNYMESLNTDKANLFDTLLIQNGWIDEKNLSLNQILNYIKSTYIFKNDSDPLNNSELTDNIIKLQTYFKSILKMNDSKNFIEPRLLESINRLLVDLDGIQNGNGAHFKFSTINVKVVELTTRIETAFVKHKESLLKKLFTTNHFNILFELITKTDYNDKDKVILNQFGIDTSTTNQIKTQLYELIKCIMIKDKTDCTINKYDTEGNPIVLTINLSVIKPLSKSLLYQQTIEDGKMLFNFFDKVNHLKSNNIVDVFNQMCNNDADNKNLLNSFIILAIKNYNNYDKSMCSGKIQDLFNIECLTETNKLLTLKDIKGPDCENEVLIRPTHKVQFTEYLHSFFVDQNIIYLKNVIKFSDNIKNGEAPSSIMSILNTMFSLSKYNPEDIFTICKQINDKLNKDNIEIINPFKELHDNLLEIYNEFYVIKKHKTDINPILKEDFKIKNKKISDYIIKIFTDLGLNDLIADNLPNCPLNNKKKCFIHIKILENLHKLLGVEEKDLLFLKDSTLHGHKLKDQIADVIYELMDNFEVNTNIAENTYKLYERPTKEGNIPSNNYPHIILKTFIKLQNLIYGKIPGHNVPTEFIDTTYDITNNIYDSIAINQLEKVDDLYKNISIILTNEMDLHNSITIIIKNMTSQINLLKPPIIGDNSMDPVIMSGVPSSDSNGNSKSTVMDEIIRPTGQQVDSEVHQSMPETLQQPVILDQSQTTWEKEEQAQKASIGQSEKQKSANQVANRQKLANKFAPPDDIIRITPMSVGPPDDIVDVAKPNQIPPEKKTEEPINKQPPTEHGPTPILVNCSEIRFNVYKGKFYRLDDSKFEMALDNQDAYFDQCLPMLSLSATSGDLINKLLKYIFYGLTSTWAVYWTVVNLSGGFGSIPHPAAKIAAGVAIAAATASLLSIHGLYTFKITTMLNNYVNSIDTLNKDFESKGKQEGEQLDTHIQIELGGQPLKKSQLHDYAWINFLCRFKLYEHVYTLYGWISNLKTVKKIFTDTISDVDFSQETLNDVKSKCLSQFGNINQKDINIRMPLFNFASLYVDIFNKKLIVKCLKLFLSLVKDDKDDKDDNETFRDIADKIKILIDKAEDIDKEINITEYTKFDPGYILAEQIVIGQATFEKGTEIDEPLFNNFKQNNINKIKVNRSSFYNDVITLLDDFKKLIEKIPIMIASPFSNIRDIYDYFKLFSNFTTSFHDKIKEWDEIFEESSATGIRSLFFGVPNLSPIATAYDLYVRDKKTQTNHTAATKVIKQVEYTQIDNSVYKPKLIDETNHAKSFNLFQQFVLNLYNIENKSNKELIHKNYLSTIRDRIPTYIVDISDDIICNEGLRKELYTKLHNNQIRKFTNKIPDNGQPTTQQINEDIYTHEEKQVIVCYRNIISDITQLIKNNTLNVQNNYLMDNLLYDVNINEIIEKFNMTKLIKDMTTENFKNFKKKFEEGFNKLCKGPIPTLDEDKFKDKLEIRLDDFVDTIFSTKDIKQNADCNYKVATFTILSKMFLTKYTEEQPELYYSNNYNDINNFISSLYQLFIIKNQELKNYNYIVDTNTDSEKTLTLLNKAIKIEIPHLALDPKDPNSSLVILHVLHNLNFEPTNEDQETENKRIDLKDNLLKNHKQLIYNYYTAVNDNLFTTENKINIDCVKQAYEKQKNTLHKYFQNFEHKGFFNFDNDKFNSFFSKIPDLIERSNTDRRSIKDPNYSQQEFIDNLPEYLLLITNIKYRCISASMLLENQVANYMQFNQNMREIDDQTQRDTLTEKLKIDNGINFQFLNLNLQNTAQKMIDTNGYRTDKDLHESHTNLFILQANEYLKPFLNHDYLSKGNMSTSIDIFKKIFTSLQSTHLIDTPHPYHAWLKKIFFQDFPKGISETEYKNLYKQNKTFFDYFYIGYIDWFKSFLSNNLDNDFKNKFNDFFKLKLKEFIDNEYKKENKKCQNDEELEKSFFKNIMCVDEEKSNIYDQYIKIFILNLDQIYQINNDNTCGIEYIKNGNLKEIFKILKITCATINNNTYDMTKIHLIDEVINLITKGDIITDILLNQNDTLPNYNKFNEKAFDKFKKFNMFGLFVNKIQPAIEFDVAVDNFSKNTQIIDNLKKKLENSVNNQIRTKLLDEINKCYTRDDFKRVINNILNYININLKLNHHILDDNSDKLTNEHIEILYSNQQLIKLLNKYCDGTKINTYDIKANYGTFELELITTFFFNNLQTFKTDFIKYLNSDYILEEIKNCFTYESHTYTYIDIFIDKTKRVASFKKMLEKIESKSYNLESSVEFFENINLFLCLTKKDGVSYKTHIINKFIKDNNLPKYNNLNYKALNGFFDTDHFNDIVQRVFEIKPQSLITDISIDALLNNWSQVQIDFFSKLEVQFNNLIVNDVIPVKIPNDKTPKEIEEQLILCLQTNLKIDDLTISLNTYDADLQTNLNGYNLKEIQKYTEQIFTKIEADYIKINLFNTNNNLIHNILNCFPIENDQDDTPQPNDPHITKDNIDQNLKDYANLQPEDQIRYRKLLRKYFLNLKNNNDKLIKDSTTKCNEIKTLVLDKIRQLFALGTSSLITLPDISSNIDKFVDNKKNFFNQVLMLYFNPLYIALNFEVTNSIFNKIIAMFIGKATKGSWTTESNLKKKELLLQSLIFMLHGNLKKYLDMININSLPDKLQKEIAYLSDLTKKQLVRSELLKGKKFNMGKEKWTCFEVKDSNIVMINDITKKQSSFSLEDLKKENKDYFENKILDIEFNTIIKAIQTTEVIKYLEYGKTNNWPNFVGISTSVTPSNEIDTQLFPPSLSNLTKDLTFKPLTNLIYKNEGPYTFVESKYNDITNCKNWELDEMNKVKIKNIQGNIISVNIFELLDENLGNIFKTAVLNRIIDQRPNFVFGYDSLKLNKKDCTFYFEKGFKETFLQRVFGGTEQNINLGDFNNQIKKSIMKNLFLFHQFIKSVVDKKEDNLSDLNLIFEISQQYDNNNNMILYSLFDISKDWLKLANKFRQSGGSLINQTATELEDTHITNQFINLHKWYTQPMNKQQYIDKLTDKEFLNLLNEVQNFKDKIKVELIFNSLEKVNN